jgi:hypothetical protein
MKSYIIVNLLGAAKDKVTLFLQTNDHYKITEMVKEAGYGDYKILDDWKIVYAKVINGNSSHIKYCVSYALLKNGKSESFANFENEKDALDFYESLLILPELYTANFAEVIETTG